MHIKVTGVRKDLRVIRFTFKTEMIYAFLNYSPERKNEGK